MEISIEQFANMVSFSNANIENALKNIIAESQNCVLHSMFDDKLILVDLKKDRLFEAKYSFDGNKFAIGGFEEISIVEETSDFDRIVESYFDGDMSAKKLSKKYLDTQDKEDNEFVETSIIESVSEHNPATSLPYDEFYAIKETIDFSDIKKKKFFEHYQNKILTEGFNEVEYFDFKNDVIINLNEIENKKIKVASKDRAKQLWKNKDFRLSLTEAFDIFKSNTEEGSLLLKNAFRTYSDFYMLSESEEIEIISKSLLISGKKPTEVDPIMKGYKIAKTKYGINEDKEDYLSSVKMISEEIIDTEEIANKAVAEKDASIPDDEAATDAPPEDTADQVEAPDLQVVIDKLNEMSGNVAEDDKSGLKEFLTNLASKVQEMKDSEETDPEFIKKLVALFQ
jgi:hypothetical protein